MLVQIGLRIAYHLIHRCRPIVLQLDDEVGFVILSGIDKILKVGRSLMKFQEGFFNHGISHLRPLVLKDVAEDIEMHESTVSRVTRNKYIDTQQGIFELKFFFHSGVSSYLGNTVSSVRVKEMIKKIVIEEDERKPATDDAVVTLLQSRDVKIARRTVTKYRKELGIPPASKRKKIY